MDPWLIGIVVLVVLGLAAILFGALWDRSRNRRRALEMLSPPPRDIPRFTPDNAGPHYLSELQARRPPGPASADPPATARAVVQAQISSPETVSVDAGYASRDFVTDRTASWALLDDPLVLVCADPVDSIRELLAVLDRALAHDTALVVVAPQLAREVLATLEVNVIQRKLRLLVVRAEGTTLAEITRATRARPIGRTDRQAGYLSADQLGRCERWVATRSSSHLIVPVDVGQRT